MKRVILTAVVAVLAALPAIAAAVTTPGPYFGGL